MHAEWPQDFLHDYTLVNHGNHPHYVLTDWATERVGVPNLHNDVAPFLGGQATRRRRDKGLLPAFAGVFERAAPHFAQGFQPLRAALVSRSSWAALNGS